jgi:hypothetical protein
MKTIEDIIRDNANLFDSNEPPEGHFERFSKKLAAKSQGGKIKKSIVPYLLKAAAVTLLVTLSSLWTWEHFLRPSSSRMTLGDVSPQYREVENYYIYRVNLLENKIRSADIASDAEHAGMLESEIKSMDSVYVQLQKELKTNPDDERIISAMIEHYQTKLEVMTYIVNQLQSLRNENQNTGKNENSEI